MTVTLMTRAAFTQILKQARREEAAHEAGFVTHDAQVQSHRAERRRTLTARRRAYLDCIGPMGERLSA